MGGQNNGRQSITMDDWMRDVEKRTMHEERRPQIRTASDLLGPGIAPRTVQLLDWNDEITLFNGFYFSAPGALHSPDPAKWWMGYSLAEESGTGYQKVYEYRGQTDDTKMASWVRRFITLAGQLRSFGPWIDATASGGGGGGGGGTSEPHRVGTSVTTTVPPTNATSGYADSGLALSFVANGTKTYRVTCVHNLRGTTAGMRMIVVVQDGTTDVYVSVMQQDATISTRTTRQFSFDFIPSAGVHNLKAVFAVSGGTAGTITFDAGPTYPASLVVDDINPGVTGGTSTVDAVHSKAGPTAALNFLTGVTTAIPLSNTFGGFSDPAGLLDAANNRFVVNRPGWWRAHLGLSVASSTAGIRAPVILAGPSATPAQAALKQVPPNTTGSSWVDTLTGSMRLNAGDVISATFLQNSGATLACNIGIASYLEVLWEGP